MAHDEVDRVEEHAGGGYRDDHVPHPAETPAARHRLRVAARYDWADSLPRRRWERPDDKDPANLAILLRQAAEAVEQAVARCLDGTDAARRVPGRAPVDPSRRGVRNGTGQVADMHALRRLAARRSGPTQLAEYLDRSPATTSRMLARFEKNGLVESDVRLDDGRSTMAWLTPDGQDVVDEATAVMAEVAAEVSGSLDLVQGIRLTQLLKSLSMIADTR